MLESGLLHARNLLHFFETKPDDRSQDDVLAGDYDFEARNLRIKQDYRIRLNKDLAHLTYARAGRRPEEKLWPTEEIRVPILEPSRDFVEHLLQKYLPDNDPDSIPEWEYLLEEIRSQLTDTLQLSAAPATSAGVFLSEIVNNREGSDDIATY